MLVLPGENTCKYYLYFYNIAYFNLQKYYSFILDTFGHMRPDISRNSGD